MDEMARMDRMLELELELRKDAALLVDEEDKQSVKYGQIGVRISAHLDELIAGWNECLGRLQAGVDTEARLRREAERKLHIYSEALRFTSEDVVIADLDGKMIDANPSCESALIDEEAAGANPVDERHWFGELRDQSRGAQPPQARIQVGTISDERGDPACYAVNHCSPKRSQRELEKMAFYDPVTQLPNRTLFNDRLTMALAGATRRHSMMAVIHLDIDQFKQVNDTLGRPAGDRLVVELARRITGSIRGADTIARIGGDEFAILLTQLEVPFEVVYIIERLIETIGAPVELGGMAVHIAANAGISFFPGDGQDGDTLQTYAALALREAKSRGPRQYCRFNTEMLTRSKERFSLGVQLENALNDNAFSLSYQPIINVKTGQVDSLEALIRWQKPDGQWIPPGTFIPYAEAVGLIYRIDCWVLERACSDAAAWAGNGNTALGIAVNLSAVSVQQTNMAKVVEDILRRTCLPAARLTLEITETAVIADPKVARRVLDEIVALGVSLSVDDFGTGHSSLSYLTQFPINYIKLDRLFVSRIGKDVTSEKVIQSVLDLAQRLGLRVIAEGIEEPEQQSFLTGAGCELMQGFYLMKPLHGSQLGDWLEHRALPASGRGAGVPPSLLRIF